MADSKDKTAGEHDVNKPASDFTMLKDDYVPGIGDSPSDVIHNMPAKKHEPTSPKSDRNDDGESYANVPVNKLKLSTRRDFLLYTVGGAAAAAGIWWLLPDDTKARAVPAATRKELDSVTARLGLNANRQQKLLGRVLTFDDDVAEALYSPTRSVPTYRTSDITPNLRNNYDGATPDPSYLKDWTLTISGLASGEDVTLTAQDLLTRFAHHSQITRLCCVEGWSAIVGWGGLRFSDLIKAYPPARGMRWAALQSDVNLDADGNSDPYYVSIDLPTAMHPQTLLATHQNGQPLNVDHGAPLRLIAPMKLGLKNIKAITSITYTATEPADYWNERGYSKYDGI